MSPSNLTPGDPPHGKRFEPGRVGCIDTLNPYIQAHSLEKRVRVEHRYIPQEEVADYFRAANVVALPYLSGTQGGVLSAVLHFERPVVVSDVGGLAGMIPPGAGTVVGPGDPAALREALEHWLGDARGKDLSDSVRRHGQMHTWTRFSADISAMLRS